MIGEARKKSSAPASGPAQPAQPRSGAGAETALEAMIRKRQLRAGSDPTLPGLGRRKPPKK